MNNLIFLLIAALILILLSLSFSAAESAFLSINKLRVQSLRRQKNKRALRVCKLLDNKEKLINTLLVGNNIVNISLSSIITFMSLQVFGKAGVSIATGIATLLLLVFGEISPKTFATHHPETIAFFFCDFILILEILLSPIVFLLTGLSRLVLSLLKVDTKKKELSFTEDEIKTLIEVSNEQGVIEKDEKNMMHRVFKFKDLSAKDIMIPRKNIRAIHINATYSQIIEISERYSVSRFPVYKKDIDDIVGILYLKDLLFYMNNPSSFSVEKTMRPPLFILESKKMSGIEQMLHENHQSMAVVIDEYSGTSGVLTSEDIAREIFGNIADENKFYERSVDLQVEKNTTGKYVDGLARLYDINENLETHLSSEMCETLGGYVCEVLGHLPRVGESIIKDGYKFTVSRMDDKRVAGVLIRKEKDEEEEE